MLKMGIIGFGGMASYHAKQLEDYGRIKVVAVYDVNPERMLFANEKGYKTYESVKEILDDQSLDVILIGTTNEVHKELSINAMRAGKHVICEKPVTLTSDELEEIIEAEKQTGKIFTINQNRRTNKDFVLMRNKVEEGLLGDIYVIESRVEGSRGMPRGWRTIKKLGGGMMLDWGVHLIDQLLYMIDEKVINVFCKMYSIESSEVEDNFRLTMTFEGGLTAHIEVSTNNYITHPRWYVLGMNGTLQIDDWDCDGKVIRCSDKQVEWENEIVYTKAGPTKTMAPRRGEAIEEIIISEPMDVVDSITVVYDQLIDAIEGKKALDITSIQALRVMKVMEAAFESDKYSRVVNTKI